MTIPFERTRSILQARELLKQLQDIGESPSIPSWVRQHAKDLLEHYPTFADIEQAHKALPDLFEPVPPFSRRSGTGDVRGVIDATRSSLS